MQSQTKEKAIRVFELAKELNLESRALLDFCKELGFNDVKNQLKGLTTDQVDALKDRVKKGPKVSSPTPPPPTNRPVVIPPPAKLDQKIKTLPKAAPSKATAPAETVPAAEEPVAEPAPAATPTQEPVASAPPEPTSSPAEPVTQEQPLSPPESAAAEAPPAPAVPKNIIPPQMTGGGRVPGIGGRKPLDLNRRSQAASRPAPAAPTSGETKPASPPPPPPAPVEPKPTPPAPVAEEKEKAPAPEVKPAAPAAQEPTAPSRPTPPPPPMGAGAPPSRSGTIPTIPGSGSGGRPGQGSLPSSGSRSGSPMRSGPGAGGGPGSQRPGPGGRQGGPVGTSTPPRSGMKPPVVPPPKSASGGPMKLTPEMMEKIRKMSEAGKRADIKEIAKSGSVGPTDKSPAPGAPGAGSGRPAPRKVSHTAPPTTEEVSDDDDKKAKRPGEIVGRDARHKSRQVRGGDRRPATDRAAVVIGKDGQVETIDQQFGSRRGPRAAQLRKLMRGKQQVVKKEGPVEVSPPITVRSLSEAIGMKAGELSKRLLKETGKLYAINSQVEFDVAELIAIEKGITLILKKQSTAEDRLLDEYEKRANEVEPELLLPRPPVVTIMGHVDHGKTSLLDRIRQSNVVDTETGGITQVIRAWSVTHNERVVTFLDTPGHEAFTKMRARGANVTDIVVIVVAATDGVMPQTEEAINHAKAAEVDIIVAINKIDMPNANVDKTRRQLYSLGLLPDNMGGEVPFVETSAVTGEGIDELLESILLVSELADLKADPTHPASGTCLEAYLQGQEGVMATLLIQQGTLHKGDVILCGSTYGRVRAMYNDLGKPISEAGPSMPVRITGLDEVPDADDPFYVVEEIGTAREIAEKRKTLRQAAAQSTFTPVSLENLSATRAQAKITELKVILKAEARGSVEAIRKELEKLVHEEVRTRVLHAGIGAITESDVILALTSPNDTLVIGFNVTADDPALALAEQRGINIREYQIIYNLVDDVKAAMEGRLKPVEEVVHLGRAVVRETFKISKVGTIAGCYVTSGTIERSARVRVIRQGVVIFPHGDKVVGLESLKRFKDDVKEVREGFECGMKLANFDDIKVDDVIEAYKIEVRQRTL